jgi:predicted  nucleic acid-binding Zn-ribbon protein
VSVQNGAIVESDAIARDIEGLEQELSSLRARVATDSSSFSALENQVAELRERLLRTQENVRAQEKRLADKQAELAEAKRLERLAAFDGDLARHRDAGARVATSASALLEALEAYDNETVALRNLVEEMVTAFGRDERVAEVEAALEEEPEELHRAWEALVAAVKWRIREPVEASEVKPEQEDLSEELQGLAEERRRTRIMEYFGKS